MKTKPVAVALGNGRIRMYRGPTAAADAAAFRKTLPAPRTRARAKVPTVKAVVAAVKDVRKRIADVAASEEAIQAGRDEPEVEALLASRPDLTPEFADKLRGKTLSRVEAVLGQLPAPTAQRQEQQVRMGLLRREPGGAELRGSKLTFGANRTVRSEGIQ
jgi:hypothetical protein